MRTNALFIPVMLCIFAAIWSPCNAQNGSKRLYETTLECAVSYNPTVYSLMNHSYYYYRNTGTNDLDSLITMAYDPNNHVFYPGIRRVYHYNANGTLTQMECWSQSYPNFQIWYNRYDYRYDAQDRLASMFAYYRFYGETQLNDYARRYYIYGAAGGQTCLQQIVNHQYEPPYGLTREYFSYQNSAHGYRLSWNRKSQSADSLTWEETSDIHYTYMAADSSNTLTFLNNIIQKELNQTSASGLDYLDYGLLYHKENFVPLGISVALYNYIYDDSLQLEQINHYSNPHLITDYSYSYSNGYPVTCIKHSTSSGLPLERYTYTWGSDTYNDDPNQLPATAFTIKAWPNPFSSKLSLMLSDTSKQPVKTCVYNLKGKKVFTFPVSRDALLNWNGTDQHGKLLPSGVYLIKVEAQDKSAVCRVVLLK